MGEAFEDLIFHGLRRLPRAGEELRTPNVARTMGGGTLITAVAAARMGARVEVISALSVEAARRLRAEGVHVRNLRRAGEPHAVSVALSTRRERAFVTFDGVNDALEARVLDDLARRRLPTAHLHIALGPRNLAGWIRTLARLRARGITTSWDFGWHDELPGRPGFETLLGAPDWIFVNEREARLYTGTTTMARALRRWRTAARGVVVKQGARGALALVNGAIVRVPAPGVRVVDTTGAGDAFNGGFLAALVRGRPLVACLRAGVRVGSLSTRAAGGLDALPFSRDVRGAGRRKAS
ncbi:MAG: carbohydrate kinase family protein [Acidobacteria bacterium]|nr:carbohydrate kinase family protein [Acidobacteriota bacterium]